MGSSRVGRGTTMDRSIRWISSLAIVLLLSAACSVGIADPTSTPEASTPADVEPERAASTPEATSAGAPSPTVVARATPTSSSSPVPVPTHTPTSTPVPVPPPTASFSLDVSSGSAPLTVRFSNTSQGQVTDWEWDFGDGATSDVTSPVHRYTIAGSYTVTLKVSGPGGSDTNVMADLMTVLPGPPVSLEVYPPTAPPAIKETAQFTTIARDQFGNVYPGTVVWSVAAGAGSIDPDGVFAAGTVAGVFADAVKASLQTGAGELVASGSVTVEPGPVSSVVVEPTEATLDIGAAQAFTFAAFDEFGNVISDVLSSWSAQPDAGVIDATGLFSAGTKAGGYPAAIGVAVVKGTARARATAGVSISPGPLATIEVDPSFSVVERQATQQFAAAGVDQHGNEVPGLALLWESTGGAITQGGLFTAGGQSGAYEVRVAATFKDNTSTGSATIPIPPVWIPVGNMLAARSYHTATLLPDGKVLMVGGGAELYDPVTRTFSGAGIARCANGWGSEATLLADGRVLITGGNGEPRCAEIYDSETGAFSRAGDLNADHWGHATTLLSDGRVLIVGGVKRLDDGEMTHAVVEIYDPATETFSVTGSLNTARSFHTVTSLPSGQVLITGGQRCMASPELYDPSTGAFSPIGGVLSNACGHSATLLNGGKVLITSHDREAFLFDPVTGTFHTAGVMTTGRAWATASLLPNGHVLITGGWSRWPIFLATAELYDPEYHTSSIPPIEPTKQAGTFTATDGMSQARQRHTATLLPNGHVLIAGGQTPITTSPGETVAETETTSAELYIPSRAIQPPAGLVSWWPGDGNANDIVGGNDGTLSGDATFAPGIVGQAFSFDGADDFVDIGDIVDFEITSTSSMSITGWVKTSANGPAMVVTKMGILSPDFGWLVMIASGVLRLEIADNDDHVTIDTIAVNDDQWHHFALTHDGSTGNVNLYVDSVLRGSTTESFGAIDDGGMPLRIGMGSQGGNPFPGLIDEVAFFNRALSAAEIKAIYDAGSAGMARPTPTAPIPAEPQASPSGGDCQQYLELTVLASGEVEKAVVTYYRCDAMYVDSTGRSPSRTPSISVSSDAPLGLRLGADHQPTSVEIRLYAGGGKSGSFGLWPDELPGGEEPADTHQPEPSLEFVYDPAVPSGEYSLVVRATWSGLPVDVLYATSIRVD